MNEEKKQLDLDLINTPNYLNPDYDFVKEFYDTIHERFIRNMDGSTGTFVINYLEMNFEELKVKFNSNTFEQLYYEFIKHLADGFVIFINTEEKKEFKEILEIAYSDFKNSLIDNSLTSSEKKDHYNYYTSVFQEYINDYMVVVKQCFVKAKTKKGEH